MRRETIEGWVRVQIGLLWASVVAGMLMPILFREEFGWLALLLIPLPLLAIHTGLLFINTVLSDTVPGYSEVFEDARERL